MATALDAIRAHPEKVDGIKISLLDAAWEIEMRRQLPAGVACYTGDDFNFAELIAGDEEGHSDALLGIFDAIAPAASAALSRLAAGDEAGFHDILAPTVPLSRLIFAAPTRFYKTGIVFLAWLNGHQDHFTMVGGQESARSILHLAEVFRLADQARLFRDPALAAERMRRLLAVARDRLSACAIFPPTTALEHLSLNTATVRKQGDFLAILEAAKRHGISCLSPWRDQVAGGRPRRAPSKARARRRLPPLRLLPRRHVPGRCGASRAEMLDDNRRAIDEAAALGAPCLVLVVGGLPQFSRPGSAPSNDIAGARDAGRGGDRRASRSRERRRRRRSRSSRCIRCTPPTAPA